MIFASLPFTPRHVARAASLTAALAALAMQAVYAQQAAPVPRPAASVVDDGTPRAKDDVVRLGTITVIGSGDRLGAGQLINEDTVKSRSTVTKASIEKDLATTNLYQSISLLPGVNTFNHDSTGLFGGGLTMRGFNSDQIGLTINGVPVNDSGNFAVFPQEYVDSENVCTNTVAQGSSDQETPHVGASGGSIGLTTCDPLDVRRVRVAQTLGSLQLSRSYVRYDTGRFASDKAKMFVSYTHSQANKWKGEGGAKRDHVDVGFAWDLTPGNRILGSVVYNKAVNNNINTLSLAQLQANGYNFDNSTVFSGKLTPVNGTTQTELVTSPAFYKLSLNPFENAIGSLSGSFQLSENLLLKVQPYFWYGFGTGGVQHRNLFENGFLNAGTGTLVGTKDLNGDGDTRDRIIVASSNITRTQRPGVTTELNWLLGDHSVKLGFWFERAKHTQTGPAVPVDADGNPTTVWLNEGNIQRADGTYYQSRDWTSVSTARSFYVTDNFNFLDDRGVVSAGVRLPTMTRDFTNRPNEGANSQIGYNLTRSYSDTLPQVGVRFKLDREQQVFANIGKNFRAPPNFALAATNSNIQIIGGVPTLVVEAQPETSINTDIGYRYQGNFSLSVSVFNIDFKNRQGNAIDPLTLRNTYTNVGSVRNRGLELEMGTKPYKGFTGYLSFTHQKSEVLNDLQINTATLLQTKGKEFNMTPGQMAAASVQYASGPLYVRMKVKDTGKQFATLMNDEEVPAYTVVDLDAGYKLGNIGIGKDTQLRFNLSNVFNKQYRNPSSGSVINARAYGTEPARTVFYYLGAPRFFSMSLTTDF